MNDLDGKVAVVTGGGTGMGRELCVQLSRAGCRVASCDLLMDNLEETGQLCEEASSAKITLHRCDVSCEADMNLFRDQVVAEHGERINLLFNNAGIGGGGSFTLDEDRPDWERTFAVCWYGVYYGCRAFLRNLIASDEAHIVNTSSINGFWASIGPTVPHTAYSAAKFAVKGFSEALITDLRIHAPHVKVSLVMPGHIGTSIAINSGKVLGHAGALEMGDDEVRALRERMMAAGGEQAALLMNLPDDRIREFMHQRSIDFRDKAPTSASRAAEIIIADILAGKWRILVGEDAHNLDRRVRENPEGAYEPEFIEGLIAAGEFGETLIVSTR